MKIKLRGLLNFVRSEIKFLRRPRKALGALQSVTNQNGDRAGKISSVFGSWTVKTCNNGAQKLQPCVR
jgi:hypothetical protein